MSDSVRPHRQPPTRLLCPWDSAGKNTGVGCHFLLQCMKVKIESEVAQSCLTLSDLMDCSLPGSSVHGILGKSTGVGCHIQRNTRLQFSRSVVSDSLQPHGVQHSRLPCPSPTPRACSNSCPSGWWCHPTISSSVILFSSCLQSCLASGSFPMSQFFVSGGQSIGASASASLLPMNIQDSFPLGWTGLISLQSKWLSRVLQHHSSRASILWCSAFFTVQLLHPYMTTGKTIALTWQTFVDKVMSLLLNMLSRLVIAFLPRSKHLLISWLQSPSAVILEPPK